MLTTRASQRFLDAEVSRCGFIPFLYRTRTIQRSFADSHGEAGDDCQSGPKIRRIIANANYEGDESKNIQKQRSERRPSADKVRPSFEKRDKVDHVPFLSRYSTHGAARVEGTTITPKELHVFEKLLKAKPVQAEGGDSKPQNQRSAKKGYRPSSKRYGAIAPESKHEFPDLLRPLVAERAALRARASIEKDADAGSGLESPPTRRDKVAMAELESIKSSMDYAATDVDLWAVLQERVFRKIKKLPRSSKPGESGQDFEVLAQTLPQSLLHFMTVVRNSFPGSPLGLALLPTLKRLGPSAFALGASTELFNEHVWMLYHHYADLDSINETLTEMDKTVYELDAGTKSLLRTILQDGSRALSLNSGPGLQALWSTDRKTRGLEKIRRWDGIIEERLKAAALNAVRAKELYDSEYEGKDNQLAVA